MRGLLLCVKIRKGDKMDLKIEYVPIDSIKPYSKNAKLHPQEQIEQIKKSIEEFGNCDPIGIWNGEVVEGHGRLMALKEMGADTVPVIRLDHLTDEQRRAYALVHNKLTMNSPFDDGILSEELENILDIDMSMFDFDFSFDDEEAPAEPNKYTEEINAPQYEIKGENPSISELVNADKTRELEHNIQKANIPDDIKDFLLLAAKRHLKFDYCKIAEYYAHAPKEVQELMEQSALVIIDFKDAIKYGYAELSENIEQAGGENEE